MHYLYFRVQFLSRIHILASMKALLSLLFILPLISMAQQRNTPVFYGQVGYNMVFNAEIPAIKHMPHKVYQWEALDGSEFTADKKNKPLYYRFPLSLTLGATLTSSKQNIVSIGLSYNHYVRRDTLGSKLRYTDQVDSRAGFTNTSYFELSDGYHVYRSVGFELDYLFVDAIGSYEHRLGFGMGIQGILGSRYFLNHLNTQNGENTDFAGENLTLSDKIWIFNPAFLYQSKVYSASKLDYWIVGTARLSVQKKYEVEPLGNLVCIGIRVELK